MKRKPQKYDVAVIENLIADIESSTGIDPKIDAAIERLFLSSSEVTAKQTVYTVNFTGSLETVIALVEQNLPEYGDWIITKGKCCDCNEPMYGTSLSPPGHPEFDGLIMEHDASPAHALLLSFLHGILLRQEATIEKVVSHAAPKGLQ